MSSIGIRNGRVNRTLRLRNVLVDSLHKLVNLRFPLGFAIERSESRPADDWGIVARVLVLRKKFADLHLHQLDQLFVF